MRKIAAFICPMQIPMHGAFTSFFIVLSVFPTMVLFFALLTYTSLGLEEVLPVVECSLPSCLPSGDILKGINLIK